MTPAEDVPLPPGTRLLHIGPQKTGTTALQGAFHAARRELDAQGVHYAGRNRQPRQAALAVAAETSEHARRRVRKSSHWQSLLRDVESAKATRVVISSEDFADVAPGAIPQLIDDLDRSRVHVVTTLRPLARILPSQWQQLVQGGVTVPYQDWLRNVFDQPASGTATRFWYRHRHHELIARWAAVVGRANVTAVVVEDRAPDEALRSFEQLLGLRVGTLAGVKLGSNRSLTRSEIEIVRAAHAVFREIDLETGLRHDVVSRGIASSIKLRMPGPDEPRTETPPREHARVLAASREIVDGIRALGVGVVGDLELLVEGPAESTAADARVAEGAWPAIGGRALMGALIQTGATRGGGAKAGGGSWPDGDVVAVDGVAPTTNLAEWSTPRIASHIYDRLKGSVRARLPRRMVRKPPIHSDPVRPSEEAE